MSRRSFRLLARIVAVTSCFPAWGGEVEMVSLSQTGAQGIVGTTGLAAISSEGRYVAYTTQSGNLIPGMPSQIVAPHVVIKDLATGAVEWVTKNAAGQAANGQSWPGNFSGDARYLTIYTNATNLYPGIIGLVSGLLLYDRQMQSFAPITIGPNGEKPDSDSNDPRVSADGRYVAFQSYASNLVAGDTNGVSDVFVRDMILGVTQRVNVGSTGQQETSGDSKMVAIAADGRYVAFVTKHPHAANDTNGKFDVYRKDLQTGAVMLVSSTAAGAVTTQGVEESRVRISADGNRIAFHSTALNFVPGDTTSQDIFVKDLTSGALVRATQTSQGVGANASSLLTGLSADGRFVLFASDATNLTLADVNAAGTGTKKDVFLHDTLSRVTVALNVTANGVTSQFEGSGHNGDLSENGRFAVFASDAHDLVVNDANGFRDVFRVDAGFVEHGGGFTSLALRPRLKGTGFAEPLGSCALTLSNAPRSSTVVIVASNGYQSVVFPGGVLLPKSPWLTFPFVTDSAGELALPFTLGPASLAPGAVNLQAVIATPGLHGGFVLSNATAALIR